MEQIRKIEQLLKNIFCFAKLFCCRYCNILIKKQLFTIKIINFNIQNIQKLMKWFCIRQLLYRSYTLFICLIFITHTLSVLLLLHKTGLNVRLYSL